MAARVKILYITPEGSRLEAVGILNGGFETEEPCVLLPYRAAQALFSDFPANTSLVTGEVATGEGELIEVRERIKARILTHDREGPLIECRVFAATGAREILLSDVAIDGARSDFLRGHQYSQGSRIHNAGHFVKKITIMFLLVTCVSCVATASRNLTFERYVTNGVDGVFLGSTRSVVQRVVGKPTQVVTPSSETAFLFYASIGLVICISKDVVVGVIALTNPNHLVASAREWQVDAGQRKVFEETMSAFKGMEQYTRLILGCSATETEDSILERMNSQKMAPIIDKEENARIIRVPVEGGLDIRFIFIDDKLVAVSFGLPLRW